MVIFHSIKHLFERQLNYNTIVLNSNMESHNHITNNVISIAFLLKETFMKEYYNYINEDSYILSLQNLYFNEAKYMK